MKGKQLTLQEVLNLEDGSKVWVEDTSKIFEDDLYIYDKENIRVNLLTKESKYGYDLMTIGDFRGRIKFYEWIKDNSNPMMLFDEDDDSNIINKMSVEICNLRGLDLTDDNIRLIIEEFMEEK